MQEVLSTLRINDKVNPGGQVVIKHYLAMFVAAEHQHRKSRQRNHSPFIFPGFNNDTWHLFSPTNWVRCSLDFVLVARLLISGSKR
jgi:hypothetical protein